MTDHGTVQHLEALSMNAWPAQRSMHYDGWVLRFTEGYTRRANSVSSLYSSSIDPLEKIEHCESLYAAQGLPAVFKLTDATHPADLDAFLAALGYKRDAETSVLSRSITGLAVIIEPEAHGEESFSESWLALYNQLAPIKAEHQAVRRGLLASVEQPHCFLTLLHEGQPAAIGMAVYERGHVGLQSVIVRSDLRRRGLGLRVTTNLLAWGQAQGATQAYLQVMTNNAASLGMVSKLGFEEVYHYWYRGQPVTGD